MFASKLHVRQQGCVLPVFLVMPRIVGVHARD
jgi:hypothetical protein